MSGKLILVDGLKIRPRYEVANYLARAFNADYRQCSLKTTPAEYVTMMKPALDRGLPVVIETSWLAHQIARRLGLKSVGSSGHFRALDRIALGAGAIRVHVVTSLETALVNACQEQGGALGTSQIQLIIRSHREWENDLESPIESLEINPLVQDFADYLYPTCKYMLDSMEWRGPGCGNFTGARVLLVGDRHGPTSQPYSLARNVPFVSMSGRGCSDWLNRELDRAGIDESKLYWINAYGLNGPTPFPENYRHLPVMALGSAARHYCRINDVECEEYAHPQFWMRFRAHQPYPLIETLKNLAR